MSETERPNLSLGEPPERLRKKTTSQSWRLIVVVLITQVAVLYYLSVIAGRLAPLAEKTGGIPAATSAELKTLAVELEDRGLDEQAANAWMEYLDANPGDGEYAEILYRIGKLQMQAEGFDRAAASFVRAQLAAEEGGELGGKIGSKLIECLRRSGRYGEVGRELSRQVRAGDEEPGRGSVLATMSGDEITDADLDQMIEQRVDRMLAMQGSSNDPAAREAVLRQLSAPQMRRQLLEEMLQTELSCRRARELKIDREEEFIQARNQMVDTLLANRFLARELDGVRPTGVDLEAHYEAGKERYREPESIDVISIRIAPDEDAAELAGRLTSADDFRRLAEERQSGEDAEGSPTRPATARRLARGREDPILGDTEPLFKLAQDEWTKETHTGSGDTEYFVLVEKKNAARIPRLDEIESRVRAEYTARKQRELSEQLFRDLMARYEVRLIDPKQNPDQPQEASDETEEQDQP